MSELTYWNGERCFARKVRLVVDDMPEFEKYWGREFVGQERDAVEVTYAGRTFWIDDDEYVSPPLPPEFAERFGLTAESRHIPAGSGWLKVTAGSGSPQWGHRELRPVAGSLQERDG